MNPREFDVSLRKMIEELPDDTHECDIFTNYVINKLRILSLDMMTKRVIKSGLPIPEGLRVRNPLHRKAWEINDKPMTKDEVNELYTFLQSILYQDQPLDRKAIRLCGFVAECLEPILEISCSTIIKSARRHPLFDLLPSPRNTLDLQDLIFALDDAILRNQKKTIIEGKVYDLSEIANMISASYKDLGITDFSKAYYKESRHLYALEHPISLSSSSSSLFARSSKQSEGEKEQIDAIARPIYPS